jgi:hypothetical protein
VQKRREEKRREENKLVLPHLDSPACIQASINIAAERKDVWGVLMQVL